MELKQSKAVPFAVNDPISGLDITKDVQLVSIESVGEGDFPYFQPNGDYTFTVVNAARDEIVTPTTFTLDVPYNGEVHRLSATTDMAIKATEAAFMKVTLIKPATVTIIGKAGENYIVEFEASYRGKQLKAADIIPRLYAPGAPVVSGPNTFVSKEDVPGTNTIRTTWKAGPNAQVGGWNIYIIRMDSQGSVPGEDYVAVNLAIRLGDAGLRFTPQHYNSHVLFGHQGELINSWWDLNYNGTRIPLNDPGLTFTFTPIDSITNITTVIGLDAKHPDYIVLKILGKPNKALSDGVFQGEFSITAKYAGLSSTYNCAINWYPGNIAQIPMTIIPDLYANSEQKAVTQFGDINPNGSRVWYTLNGSKLRAGTITVTDFTKGTVLQTYNCAGMPLNSIHQIVKEIELSWMKQRVAFTGVVIDCPLTNIQGQMYQTLWLDSAQTTIEMAPLDITPNATVVPGTAGSAMSVLLTATQKRGNEIVHVPGSWSAGSVTGAANYLQLISTMDGDGLFRMTGKGTNGDVLLKGTFTSTADGITQPFEVKIMADASYIFEMNPKSVDVKMWDVLSTPPFTVKIDRVEAPQRITNVRVIKNAYIQGVEDNPNEWEVYKADGGEVSPSTYFIFDLVLDSGTISCIGQGTYKIAGWDGRWITPNAEYTPGDKVTKIFRLPIGGQNSFKIYPTYKGQPAADKIVLQPLSATYFEMVSQVVNLEENSVTITLGGLPRLGSGNVWFFYQVKDIPVGELVNNQTVVSEQVNIQAVQAGLAVTNVNPVPSSVGKNVTLRWLAKFYYDGVWVPNYDPNLSIEILGTDAGDVYVTQAGAQADTIYFILDKVPPSNGAFVQRFVASYNKDGVVHSAPEARWGVTFDSSRNQPEITITMKSAPLANTDNLIPVDIRVGTNDPLAPSTIDPRGVSVVQDPPNGNGVVDSLVEYVNTGHLKFKSGWTGGNVKFTMTIGSGLAPNSTIPLIFDVPRSDIIITQTVNEFSGITDATTQIGFALSQQRLINGVMETYDFSDATVDATATFTGPVTSVTGITNTNGSFTADVVGKGDTGAATITFKVTDVTGFVYDVEVGLEAMIDSSGYILTLTPDTATGNKGDRITFTGSLTFEGTNQRLDDVGQTWTIEPAGYMTVGMRNASDVRFDITRSTTDVENVEVSLVVKDRAGYTAKHKVALEVKPDMVITPKVMNVKVWDTVSGVPFTIMDSSGIVINPLDAKPQDNDLLIPAALAGEFIVQAETPHPARIVPITWEYRLPDDPVGTVRTVTINYNVSAYNGMELTASAIGPWTPDGIVKTYTTNTSISMLVVTVYRRGVKVTERCTYGNAMEPDTYLRISKVTGATGQVTFQLLPNPVTVAEGPVKIRVDVGGSPWDQEGVNWCWCDFGVSIYDGDKPGVIKPPVPNPIEGKLGDEFEIYSPLFWQNNKDWGEFLWNSNKVTNKRIDSTRLEFVPDSFAKDGYSVRIAEDIDTNVEEYTVTIYLTFNSKEYSSQLTVTQHATQLKLAPAPGFQTTGSGDVDNPVTLIQNVLDPE